MIVDDEAFAILKKLNGQKHQLISSGVYLKMEL
jgi:predicted house-cleaning NTP pyrophosphatase (Maf/HAM1 superfamily)